MSASNSTVEPAEAIRILLIEDNADDAGRLCELLAHTPVEFQITQVTRLDAALERLGQGGIDVILTDLSLPDCRGVELFRALFVRSAYIPIIVLSDQIDEDCALATVEQGAQEYLVKGQIGKELLVRSIRYAIKRTEVDRALSAERNLLKTVVNTLVDAVYVKNREGIYVLGNTAHARQLGLRSPDDVIGKRTEDFFPEENAKQFRADDEVVMTTGEPIINRHERVEEKGKPVRWLSTTKVPLRDASGEIIGVLGIGRDITARKLAEEKLACYTQELKEKNAEMADDLEMAREVQQAFLPQQFSTFPRHALPEELALSFHSKYLPTGTLGGDFFHVISVSEKEAGVLICDVMGHGVRAALVTAIQRALVEELTEFAAQPGEFLTRMNESLVSILRRTRSPMFASAFYLVINIETGAIRYANAGHPRPLLLKRGRGEVAAMNGPGTRPGPALGVFENSEYAQQEASLQPRDLVLLFTDGLYEVENARGEFYDQEMLLQSTQQRLQRTAEEIIDLTLDEVRQFSLTHDFIDDVCLVGVEFIRLAQVSSNGSRKRRGR